MKKLLSIIIICAVLAVGLGGCKKNSGSASTDGTEKKTIKLAYVNWVEGVALTQLMKHILTDMGYDVETTMADVAPIFAAVAGGDQDIMIETWMPVMHDAYWKQYSKDFEDLGAWLDEGRVGLVVPAYMEIDSIEQLGSLEKALEGKITGIDAGAGVMNTTELAIKEYKLNYELISSSGPAMTAALKSAIDRKQPIVVTGWTPHWKFARYDLKFLDDPMGVYGAVEEVKFICRKGFKQDNPEVANLFLNVKFTVEQIASLMDVFSKAEGKEEQAIKTWISENQQLVDSWK